MALSTLATETDAAAVIAEARRCLNNGSGMSGRFLISCINQLMLMTTTDSSARADILPNSTLDGRNAADATTAGG